MASAESNAIGSVELECTPAGLALGLFGVGAFQAGYAPGALTHGTRFCVPFANITSAQAAGEELHLRIENPGFPHSRLTLARFSAGPGVPPLELRRRRLILHVAALSVSALATLAAAMLVPSGPGETVAWAALAYGAVAAALVLTLGYSLDRQLLVRAPDERAARTAFVRELAGYLPSLRTSNESISQPPQLRLPQLSGWLPRSAAGVGVLVAATVLTALVSGQRLLLRERGEAVTASLGPRAPTTREDAAPAVAQPAAPPAAATPRQPVAPPPKDAGAVADGTLSVERRCLCDRADSPLWNAPIPRLSALLIEKRVVPRKSYLRLRLEVAVVNNGDSPLEDITVHVQFYETDARKKRRHTKERPLYFEGPLRPGEAIKWSTEARGTEFEIQAPDFGTLGVDSQGSASPDDLAKLLEANHRPVRLHAARMLSYLGDPRGRVGALALKDAMRAAEGPYLRRVLAATAELRVCDIDREQPGTIGACVYNAGDSARDNVGLEVSSLDGSLEVSHPLAHPPAIAHQKKWKLPEPLDAQAGRYVRVAVPSGFLAGAATSIEVNADRFDLLD